MALNKKTFAIRSLSALVFGILLIGSVYWNYLSFSIFFFVVALIGLNEFYRIAERLGAKPLKITGFLGGILVYGRFINYDEFGQLAENTILKVIDVLLILIPFLLFLSLLSKKEASIKNVVFTIGGVLYAFLPFALLNKTAFNGSFGEGMASYQPKLILGIIFLIWSNDTFAYIGGSLFGKHKMIERISPGKTWEGTIIGVLLTFALSFSFDYFYPLNNLSWSVLGICIPVLATVGDLIESKLKREADLKDSGNIMPGHGGVLDRFDSLIFVSPFVYAIFSLFQ